MRLLTDQVHAVLPRAGLGNRLLVWARALAFARLNGLPFTCGTWAWPQLGRVLRGQGGWRFYRGQLRASHEAGRPREWLAERLYAKVTEPPVARLPTPAGLRPRLFVFDQLPHWSDYYGALHPHRELVRRELYACLDPRTVASASRFPAPVIALHVRLGDFRPLKPGESFAKVGGVRTPLDYFTGLLGEMRRLVAAPLPAQIFSDGTDAELAPLLALPAVTRARTGDDISELLLLSRSGLIVTSAGSTFSHWAGFLGDTALLLHPEHVHASIRPAEVNERYYEGTAVGPAESWPELLRSNLLELSRTSEAPPGSASRLASASRDG